MSAVNTTTATTTTMTTITTKSKKSRIKAEHQNRITAVQQTFANCQTKK